MKDNGKKKSDLFLIYPCNHRRWPLLPNSVLALMDPLMKAGFSPKIVDTAVEDYRSFDYREAICIGISALTDQSILQGIEVARYIKNRYPKIPIVWGGHHPTVLPEQTIRSPVADIVCRNEGELTFPELVERMADHQLIDDVPGITWKDCHGKVFHNPDRDLIEMDSVSLYPYHLLDLKKYPVIHERFPYQSSRGCPCRCRFCSFDVLKRWRAKSHSKMVDEIGWVMETFHPQDIEMADDNFFVSKKRVRDFCEGVVNKGLSFRWSANCRFDYFSEYEDDFIELLKESGCYLLCFGGESGSDRILDYLDKKLNRQQILESVGKAKRHHLQIQISFMCGFPDETQEDILATLSLLDEIRRIYPSVEINGFFIYTPYPGSALFDEVQKFGFRPQKSLEEWGRFDPNLDHSTRTTPWILKKERTFLETISAMVRFEFLLKKYQEMSNLQKRAWFFNSVFIVKLFDLFNLFFKTSYKVRWKRRWFNFPLEWKTWTFMRDRFLGRV
jgi:radical SAM superfamily enzyme YgiQ (UPF0313 family)